MTGHQTGDQTPLMLIRGDATDEEVAAVTAIVAALAAGTTAGAAPSPPASRWAARARLVRPIVRAGPDGWRASTLPR